MQAYKLAEDKRVMLPVMVNMDGFILTHGMEVLDMPSQKEVDKFLPPYKTTYKLDVENPLTMGYLADPDYYLEIRYMVQDTHKQLLDIIPQVADDFKKAFKRGEGNGLVEGYKIEDADQVFVAMGSVCGSIRDVVDDLRAKGKKAGLLKVISYRPFPKACVASALARAKEVAVIDKSISLGAFGPLYTDVMVAVSSLGSEMPKMSGFVLGLGGRDITKRSIMDTYERLFGKQVDCEFIGLKQELLVEDK